MVYDRITCINAVPILMFSKGVGGHSFLLGCEAALLINRGPEVLIQYSGLIFKSGNVHGEYSCKFRFSAVCLCVISSTDFV